MNIQDIYNVMDRFEASSMSELELEFEGARLVCKKGYTDCAAGRTGNDSVRDRVVNVDNTAPVDDNTKNTLQNNVAPISTPDSEADKTDYVEVKSIIAGTFYRAPSPDSEPFVQVGQEVHKDDVIGMIEAMKMMNDIVAPVDGRIVEIKVKNEELVGYDDVLIVIDGGKS